jgi:hypothetical protein
MTTNQNEPTSAQSLHPKSKPHDDLEIVNAAIERILQLNQAQKKRYLDAVRLMLHSAWSKSGAGVPDGAASKNQKFNKEDWD